MRRHLLLSVVLTVLLAGLAEAGRPPVGPVPTLGETGLVLLALGFVGGGIAALRRDRKR